MKISCCWMYAIGTYGFPPSLPNMLKAIGEMADLGFEAIELEGVGFENLGDVVEHRKVLKSAIDDNGLRLSNFAIVLPEMISKDPEVAARAMAYFERGAETAAFLGSSRMWIDSYFPPLEVLDGSLMTDEITFGQQYRVRIPDDFEWPAFWDRFTGVLRRANSIAKRAGVELLVEPRMGEVTPNTDAMLRLIEAVNDRNFGVILDTAHQHAQKELLPLSVLKLGDSIRYVHVADNDGRDNFHLQPGRGTIAWDEVFRALKRIGYDGYYAIDIEKMPDLGRVFVEVRDWLETQGRKWEL